MADEGAKASDGAQVEKYSDEQVEYSRQLLGREPAGADLQAHHAAPAHGVAYGDERDQAQPDPAAPDDGQAEGEKS